MASIDAILNVVVAGSAKIDQIVNKINQLGGVIDAINKSPIDLSVSVAEAEIKKFNNAVLAIGKNLKTAQTSVDAATAKIERYQKAYEAAEKAIAAANPNTKKYEQAIERRRKANEGLIASLAELKQAEELIGKIDSSGALENAENRKKEAQEAARLTKQINTLSEQYLKYGEAQKRASGGQFAGPAPKTISQLNAQAQALALIASNSEVATAAFNRFTLAAELAGQATYYAQQEQLKALSSGLSAEAPGVGFGKGSIAAARSQVQEFVNSYAALTKSEAAMSAFVTQAQRLKSLLPDTVKEFTMLEEIIAKASEELKSIGSIGKIKIQLEADQALFDRLNKLARLRGNTEAYDQPIGPLPAGRPGAARYYQEAQQLAKELLDVEGEIASIREKSIVETLRLEAERLETVKKIAKEAGNVLLDAVSFGKSGQVKKTVGDVVTGSRNALVRGGLGLGALGAGGLYEGFTQGITGLGDVNLGPANIFKGPVGAAASFIGDSINSALGGVPEIIGNLLSALGDIPGALGIAAAAAYAFAPAMKTAGEAVFEAGKKFGETSFGQNIKLTLDRQTNLFEDVIYAASEMNMALDTSKSGLDAVGQAVRSLPALPAIGQTSFRGEIRQVADRETLLAIEEAKASNKAYAGGMTTTFMGGGARRLLNRDYLSNLENINGATRTLVSRSDEAAQATLMFAEKLSDAANDLDVTREATFRLSQELADAKTAFEAFRLENFAQSANAYSKAVLNINQVFRDYVAAGGKGLDVTTRQSQAYIDAANSAKEYAKSVNAVRDVSKDTGLLGYEGIESPAERLRRIQRAQESMGLQPVQAPSLALRPAGFTDQDVRIKNSLDNLAQYEQRLNKIVSDGQLELLQIQLSAELDNIETITAAQKAADDARWARETKRLEALPDIADVRRRPISFMTPQERGVLPTEGGGLRLSDGNILDPASLRADRRRRVQTLKARKEAGGRALSEGLIGGAFPLLFGQGLGASIGGLAGGVSGGLAGGGLGFGLSLVGTALGTAFDTAIQSAKDLAIALEKPVDNFDQLKERALISSKALEKQIQKTIEYGDTATASALIQSDINKRLGSATVKSLQDLAIANDEFARATSASTAQLQVFIAKMIGLAPILRGLASGAKINELQSRAQNTISELKSKGKTVAAGRLEEVFGRTRFTNITPQEYAAQLEAAILDAEKKLKPIQIKIDQKQIDESTLNALQKQLEGINIAKGITDQIRSAAREQQDLDKQRADLVRSYEESIANIRKRVEDEIARRRFSILEKENQLLDLQGQNRIKQLQKANQIIIARAGAGQRPEVEDAAKQAASIVAQFTEEQVSAEEEAAKIKRDAALDARKFDFEAATFKANIEKEVSRLNIETARQVAQINEQVRRRNEETDRKRFEIEKQIAQIGLRKFIGEVSANIENIKKQIEIAKAGGLGEMSPGVIAGRNQIASYQAQIDEYNKTISEIEKMRAPAPLRGVGAVGGGSVPTTQISTLVLEEKGKIQAITKELTKATELNVEQSIITFKNKLIDLSKAFNAPITAIATAMDDENQKNIRYTQLLSQGVKGVTAEKIIQIEQERELAKAKYNSAIAELEIQKNAEGVNAGTRAVIESQIVEYQNLRDALDGATAQLAQRAIESSRGEEVRGFINSSIESLNNLETVAIRVSQSIGDAVGNSLSEGITGLIEGTTTAEQVFADFLRNIGQILIQEGAKIIATYIAIGIAKAFAGLAGGATGGPKSDPVTNFNLAASQYGFADGGVFSGNKLTAFANGGIVDSPTLFKFADGGAMQTGVMGEAGPEAIMPLQRDANGRLGVKATGVVEALAAARGALSDGQSRSTSDPFAENRQALGGISSVERERNVERIISSGASSTEIKYSRVGSGDLPFVTEEDMLQATRVAAQEGAKLGQQRTLAALKNNPGTRRTIGI